MKTKLFFLSIVFASFVNAQSPNFQWTKSAGGTALSEVNCICTDSKGNEYMTGAFQSSTFTFGTTILKNADAAGKANDVFIVKYDAAGNVLWAKSFGGSSYDTGYGISTGENGNVTITGSFKSPKFTLGNTTLTNADTSGKTFDIFIAQYDEAGNVLWAKSIGGLGNESAVSVSSNESGCFITGYFCSKTLNFGTAVLTKIDNVEYSEDLFIAKLSGDGNVLWAKSVGGAKNEEGSCVSTDSKGNVFVTGNFTGSSITFGTTTLTNAGGDAEGYDFFLVKYDASGNVIWAKSCGGSDGDECKSIAADKNGNVFITGFFYSPVISFGSTTLNKIGIYDIFIAKYDASGNLLWAKAAGGNGDDESNSICTDTSSNVFIVGFYSSSKIIFGGSTITNADHTESSKDIFIAKYDASGNALWAKSIGGISYEYGKSIAADSNGNVFFAGLIESPTVHFGTTIITNTGKCAITLSSLGH